MGYDCRISNIVCIRRPRREYCKCSCNTDTVQGPGPSVHGKWGLIYFRTIAINLMATLGSKIITEDEGTEY